jgi:HSP20 family protein
MSLLIKPEPFARDFDRLFDRLFDAPAGAQRWAPPMDLLEAEDHYLLRADLPGLSQDDVAIELEHGTLQISGERKGSHEEHQKGWHRIERAYGKFSRSLTLPEGIDPDAVTAEFDKGVLTVRIPKPEQVKPRRIAIGSANGNGASAPEAVEGTAEEK